jgi:hypothetical protein
MIGFSAGAGLTMHSTLHSKTMKLAFIGPIYGGMGPVEVPENAPPMFNVIATDDFLFRGQFGVIESWYKAGIPVEFHLYQNGGHGFGLGNPNRTSNRWFDAFIHWLDVNKFLVAKSCHIHNPITDKGCSLYAPFGAHFKIPGQSKVFCILVSDLVKFTEAGFTVIQSICQPTAWILVGMD